MFTRLEHIIDWLTYSLLNLSSTSHRGQAINFFVYDTIKILILLCVVIYIMSLITHYFPVAKIRKILSHKKLAGFQHLLGSLFGAITPFCTCSSVPLFI